MTEYAEIEKSIDVKINVQIDHIICEGCNESLDFRVNVDCFRDLQISVEKHTCKAD